MLSDSKKLERMSGARVVPVLVPLPVPGPYSYAVPEGMSVEPGSIVQVPVGPRQVPGLVWDENGHAGAVDPSKLRAITRDFDCPPVDAVMRRFIDWVAAWTLTPPGLVARMVLRVPAAFDPEPWVPALRPVLDVKPERLTPARKRVLELVEDNPGAWTKSGLAHAAGVSNSVIEGLAKAGTFENVMLPPPPVVPEPDTGRRRMELAGDQAAAAATLRDAVAKNGFSATLIDGVTGSGKTEVYFEAVAAALEKKKQALILLPEIALTASFLERFHDRFGARPAEWHSDMAPKMREKVWRQVAEGRVQVVAGARSALFLPFKELGLIVIDEEHDQAYKQDERVFYNARDMAVVRAHLGDLPIVLASATPSIESRVNAASGRYGAVRLASRFGEAALPDLRTVDMRKNPPARGGFLSPVLLKAVGRAIERGEQALLFLNRRGYAPLTLCRVCGHRFQCPNCSAWLVEHRFRAQMQCHHCGHAEPVPEACPHCGTLDHLAACGPGVERLVEEVVHHFPEARTVMLSSDMPGGAKRLRMELDAIAKGEADIVIGTQLVAKGHHFPKMTVVGVVDADIGLTNGDPRAAERTFQLLHQVTGRAGRTGEKSLGLIQTYQPEHPVMAALVSGDREQFYEREIGERQRAGLPPFGRLAAIIISGEDKADAEKHARALRANAPASNEIDVLGPAEAPLALIRGRYRFRLLVHGDRRSDLQSYIREMIAAGPKPRGSLKVQVDIDPQSFL
ncbi:primosomal protein N' [Notoacmeibacter ruber]|uniref:Replication restart protein PriA n=1 Tax=Notoacmeibacter ruber TaxID=2670375 RepID=A0A3L7JEQ4_9HYPH|nr:primosomal protein N' [Notoacmeibacter ruber]RLQ88960.1 primosomal protein N' [Notoacmeibacter ruber]